MINHTEYAVRVSIRGDMGYMPAPPHPYLIGATPPKFFAIQRHGGEGWVLVLVTSSPFYDGLPIRLFYNSNTLR